MAITKTDLLQSEPKEQKQVEKELSNIGLIKLVWKFLGRDRFWFGFYMILMSIGIAANYAETYIIAKIVDSVIINDINSVYKLIGLFIAIGISTGILYLIANSKSKKIQVNTVFNIRQNIMQSLKRFNLNWHQNENSGNKIQKINHGIQHLRNLIQIGRGRILNQITGIVSIGAIFLFTDYRFLFVVFAYNITTFFIQRYFGKRERLLIKEQNKLQEASSGQFFEIYNNITTLKVSGSEDSMQAKLEETQIQILHLNHELDNLSNRRNLFQNITEYIFISMVLLILSFSVVNKILSIGTFAAYYSYFKRFSTNINSAIEMQEQIRKFGLSISRMMPILEETPEQYFGKQEFDNNWNKIEIQDLEFSYGKSDQTNLNKINLTINKGQKIGIVGRSGSGKSTIVKILTGLYKAKNGQILYSNNKVQTNFYDIDFGSIANHQAVVLQETELFNMTMQENITLLKDVDNQTLEKAIRISQLDEVIDKLPKGLETKVGEKGYKLSGGQKQRVGIARAICSGAEILIFDEATSALDSHTELNIQNAIEKELTDKTMLIVAHRLSTLKHVDQIIVFEDGMIVETGKFTDLIENPKTRFAKLWQLQKSGLEL
jgi:ABC-type multidrug transport system fused ATPase/permease subunit